LPHIPADILAIIGRGKLAHTWRTDFADPLPKPLASIAGSTNFKPL
jgi:hypothetical protein